MEISIRNLCVNLNMIFTSAIEEKEFLVKNWQKLLAQHPSKLVYACLGDIF